MQDLVDQLKTFPNVTMNNGYVSDDEMTEAFINSDWAILPYNSATQSGVVIDGYVINELQIPLIALGVQNLAIAATPDGILVTDKKKSDKLKDYVVDQRPMVEKRGWGEYQVLDYRIQLDGQNFLTKHLIITPGQHISYQ